MLWDNAQLPDRNKLSLFLWKSFSDCNGIAILKPEPSASSPVSSKLPVISIRKLSVIPDFPP